MILRSMMLMLMLKLMLMLIPIIALLSSFTLKSMEAAGTLKKWWNSGHQPFASPAGRF